VPTDEVTFAELVSQLDYSMFILTAAADGERAGCLIGFASQVSIDPPRFLACLSKKNRTFRVASASASASSSQGAVLVVHFVPADEEELAELFGGDTGDEIDKFARCEWLPGPEGVPILSALENWFAGRVLERLDFGDHVGFLLEPIDGEAGRGESTLTFHRAKWIEPGHEP
jgi:flavin reductase (DIM6/NTAB) family NADH-FMN oxidoreductase RutF